MFKNQISSLSNFQGIQLESDISIITIDDNINHTYCSKIKWDKDNRVATGVAQLIMPYSDDIALYWMKYTGAVVIHAVLSPKKQFENLSIMQSLPSTASLNFKKIKKEVDVEKDENKKQIHLQNDEYNYSFIGKVHRYKQVGQTFVVYLEDLGWKFLQKVPKEFRNIYIAGQSLDNAFQSMCEFMGVEFAYSIEDLHEYNFSSDGYSIEKNGEIIENTPSILEEWSNNNDEKNILNTSEDEEIANALDSVEFESSGLMEYEKKQQKTKEKIINQNNQALNSQITNIQNKKNININDDENNENEDTQDLNKKIEQYQEDFDEKIKNLFIGNTFYSSNISDPILNYDAITTQLTSVSSPEISGFNNGGENNNKTSNVNVDEIKKYASQQMLSSKKIPTLTGLFTESKKQSLSINYIYELSPAMAATMAKNPKYDEVTRNLLKIRARGK